MKRIESADDTLYKMYCNTAVQFYTQTTAYVPDQVGLSKTWQKVTSEIGENVVDVFWADWRGGFGNQQLQAMSMGVTDMATIKMDYHPTLYQLLRTKEVLIVKDAAADAVVEGQPVRNHPDVYVVWGSVDDVRSMRKVMEFKVRRFEQK